MNLFKKRTVVGVSVTPEVGLEVAQIDFSTRTVVKYGTRPLDYNIAQREISDLDIFKEKLQDVFTELQIPKGTEVVINIPAATFKINDYPAALDEYQYSSAIEEELLGLPLFKEREAGFSAVVLPGSTMQFNKVGYEAVSKAMLIEIALLIEDLGYKLIAVDSSVNSIINSLIYLDRVNTEAEMTWLLMIIDNFSCRIATMIGGSMVDIFEEKISIGEVLGDTENYSTVLNTVEPILKNLPAKYLCVVSNTNIISAEVIANKLSYSAPIIYQEANSYAKEPLLNIGPEVDPDYAKRISINVVGAGIYRDFAPYTPVHFNMFNKSLGDIYYSQQPPEIKINGKTYVLSDEFLFKVFAVIAIILLIPAILAALLFIGAIKTQKSEIAKLDRDIETATRFLKENESISAELFDEGDEIKNGLERNKAVYSYYTIVGTEIPRKLWLTHLNFSDKVTIEGQADNLESVYSFFRNIKDYNPESDIKLQKLGLATSTNNFAETGNYNLDSESLLTSLNADFYEFRISNEPEISKEALEDAVKGAAKKDKKAKSSSSSSKPAPLEPIKE